MAAESIQLSSCRAGGRARFGPERRRQETITKLPSRPSPTPRLKASSSSRALAKAITKSPHRDQMHRGIEIEKDWIPDRPMHSLYLRPTSISMDNRLGLSQIKKSKTFVILSPVGPYYPRGFVPVKLFCDTTVVRAWPSGFGDKKVGG